MRFDSPQQLLKLKTQIPGKKKLNSPFEEEKKQTRIINPFIIEVKSEQEQDEDVNSYEFFDLAEESESVHDFVQHRAKRA